MGWLFCLLCIFLHGVGHQQSPLFLKLEGSDCKILRFAQTQTVSYGHHRRPVLHNEMVPVIDGPCRVSTPNSATPNKLGMGPGNDDPSPAPPGMAHWSCRPRLVDHYGMSADFMVFWRANGRGDRWWSLVVGSTAQEWREVSLRRNILVSKSS